MSTPELEPYDDTSEEEVEDVEEEEPEDKPEVEKDAFDDPSDDDSDMFSDDDKPEESNDDSATKLEPFNNDEVESEDEESGDEIDFSKVAEVKPAEKPAKPSGPSVPEALQGLIDMLEPAETALEGIARRTKQPDEVTQMTEYCSALMSAMDVYDMSREELMRRYTQLTGETFRGTKRKREEEPETQWYFRWLGDDTVHGPYSVQEIRDWQENYFESKVEVRRDGETTFTHIDEVTL
ncbi:hypothetical protein DICA2_E14158 [Diutina catenulata]